MERKEFMRLPPGFRFHPTDEELVVQYLRRKAFSCPLPAAVIPEIDLCRLNPLDLPSGFGGEKYFFYLKAKQCEKKKAGNFCHESMFGYWKALGKERPVFSSSLGNELVGAKQAKVFHCGKSPHGWKTNWIMHEYRLSNSELFPATSGQNLLKEWVVCHIFFKRRCVAKRRAGFSKLEKARQIPQSCCSSSASSGLTDELSNEECIHGEEATSKLLVAKPLFKAKYR